MKQGEKMNQKQALIKLRDRTLADMKDIEREQLRLSGKYEVYGRTVDRIDDLLLEIEKESEVHSEAR